MAISKCKDCPRRNTAGNLNPDCHTERCAEWKEFTEAVAKEKAQKRAYTQSEGLIADGYTRRKISWAKHHKNCPQNSKLGR